MHFNVISSSLPIARDGANASSPHTPSLLPRDCPRTVSFENSEHSLKGQQEALPEGEVNVALIRTPVTLSDKDQCSKLDETFVAIWFASESQNMADSNQVVACSSPIVAEVEGTDQLRHAQLPHTANEDLASDPLHIGADDDCFTCNLAHILQDITADDEDSVFDSIIKM